MLVHNAGNYINPNDAARIQRTANEIKQPIHVVGSRASGTATPLSDWDYVIEGAKSKARSIAKRTLPKGIAGGEISPSGYETGIDIFTEPLDTLRPHVTFYPR